MLRRKDEARKLEERFEESPRKRLGIVSVMEVRRSVWRCRSTGEIRNNLGRSRGVVFLGESDAKAEVN